MVQIPIFQSETTPKKIAGVTSGVPNLVGTAMLPYQQLSKVGDTILNVGQRKYEQGLEFENKKYQQKINHENDLLRLAKDFEAKEYAEQKQHEINTYKQNVEYGLEVDKLAADLKSKQKINFIEIQRETKVKKTLALSLEPIYAAVDTWSRALDTETALAGFDTDIKKIRDKLGSEITDEFTKQLFFEQFDQDVLKYRANVSSKINQNIVDESEIIFQNEIENLKNKILADNTHFDVISLEKLIGENSIIYERYNQGLLTLEGHPVDPQVYIESLKKEIFTVMGENMSTDQPERWQFYRRQGFWQDKLSTNAIQKFDDNADRIVATRISNEKTQLRNQSSMFTTAVTNFIDPSNPDTFGDFTVYETLLSKGDLLIQNLQAMGLVTQAQSVAGSLVKLQSAYNNHSLIKELREYPLAELRDFVNTLDAKVKLTSGTKNFVQGEADLLPHAEKLLSFMETNLNSDPIGTVEQLGTANVPTINWMEKDFNVFSQNIDEYRNSIYAIKTKYNLTDIPFFRKTDLAQINEVFKTGSKEEILTLSRNVAAMGGHFSNDAFTELTTHSPAMAHLGKLINLNNGQLTDGATHIIDGYISMRNPDIAAVVNKVKLDDDIYGYRSITTKMLGGVVDVSELPDTYEQITSSAKYIFADMIASDMELQKMIDDTLVDLGNPALQTAWKMSIQYASGMIIGSDGAYGGVELFNGKPIIIPQEQKNGSLDDFNLAGKFKDNQSPSLEVLLNTYMTDDLLFKATGNRSVDVTGRSADVLTNNMPVEFDLSGKLEPKDLTADQLFKQDGYDKIFLETNEYGEYFIAFGTYPNQEYFKNKSNQKVTLNINRILQDLKNAYEAEPSLIDIDESHDAAGFVKEEIIEGYISPAYSPGS